MSDAEPNTTIVPSVGLPPTVAAYFLARLGQSTAMTSYDADPEFHIHTVCGAQCARAIDAAAVLIYHVRAAFGNDRPDIIETVRDTAAEIVCVYTFG